MIARPDGHITERVPSTKAEQTKALNAVYSLRADSQWDEMFLATTFPPEAHGKSVTQAKNDILEPIRNSIAHGLMDDGEPGLSLDDLKDHWKVNQLLPLLRFLARLMTTNEFPREFQLGTKINYLG